MNNAQQTLLVNEDTLIFMHAHGLKLSMETAEPDFFGFLEEQDSIDGVAATLHDIGHFAKIAETENISVKEAVDQALQNDTEILMNLFQRDFDTDMLEVRLVHLQVYDIGEAEPSYTTTKSSRTNDFNLCGYAVIEEKVFSEKIQALPNIMNEKQVTERLESTFNDFFITKARKKRPVYNFTVGSYLDGISCPQSRIYNIPNGSSLNERILGMVYEVKSHINNRGIVIKLEIDEDLAQLGRNVGSYINRRLAEIHGIKLPLGTIDVKGTTVSANISSYSRALAESLEKVLTTTDKGRMLDSWADEMVTILGQKSGSEKEVESCRQDNARIIIKSLIEDHNLEHEISKATYEALYLGLIRVLIRDIYGITATELTINESKYRESPF